VELLKKPGEKSAPPSKGEPVFHLEEVYHKHIPHSNLYDMWHTANIPYTPYSPRNTLLDPVTDIWWERVNVTRRTTNGVFSDGNAPENCSLVSETVNVLRYSFEHLPDQIPDWGPGERTLQAWVH
jgi:hypothetical protein